MTNNNHNVNHTINTSPPNRGHRGPPRRNKAINTTPNHDTLHTNLPATPSSSPSTRASSPSSSATLVTDLFKPSTNPAIEFLLEVQELLVDAEYLLCAKKRALARANQALALAAQAVIAAEQEIVLAASDVDTVRKEIKEHVVKCAGDIKHGYQKWRVENDLELAAARLKVLELEKKRIDFGELDELMEIAVSEREDRETAFEIVPVTLEALRP